MSTLYFLNKIPMIPAEHPAYTDSQLVLPFTINMETLLKSIEMTRTPYALHLIFIGQQPSTLPIMFWEITSHTQQWKLSVLSTCPLNSSSLLNVFQDAISREIIEKECIAVRNPSLVLLSGTLNDWKGMNLKTIQNKMHQVFVTTN